MNLPKDPDIRTEDILAIVWDAHPNSLYKQILSGQDEIAEAFFAKHIPIQRDNLTNPDMMYQACVAWIRSTEWTQVTEREQWITPEEFALNRFPDIKIAAKILAEFTALAWPYIGPVQDASYEKLWIVFHIFLQKCTINAMRIMKRLDIRDWNAFFCTTLGMMGKAWFFSHDLREECESYFSIEELKAVFSSYDDTQRTVMPTKWADMKKIVDFCCHIWFPSCEFPSIFQHLSTGSFFYPIEKDAAHEMAPLGGEIHYLWSYRREFRFLIETCKIPFTTLFHDIPNETLARVCGLIRTLENNYYKTHWIAKFIDFAIGANKTDLLPHHIFSLDTIAQYGHSHNHWLTLAQKVRFVRDQVLPVWKLLVTHSPDIHLSLHASDVLLLQGDFPEAETTEAICIARLSDFKNLDMYLLQSKALEKQLLLSMSQPSLRLLDAWCWLTIPGTIQPCDMLSTQSIQMYLDSVILHSEHRVNPDAFAEVYNLITKHIPLGNSHRASYAECREEVEKIVNLKHRSWERKSKRLLSGFRNASTIVSLAQNFSLGDREMMPHIPWYDQPSIDTQNTYASRSHPRDFTLLRHYVSQVYDFERQHKWLFSIGGKIHFSSSIPEDHIEQFKQTYWLWSSPFKLIHANTSVLLKPSQFPQELMAMIAAMSESKLFDDNPQLQVSIPGRMHNKLAGLLASSLMLLSQQHVEYTKESFDTTDNSATWRRMVAYDAWNYDSLFPWNTSNIVGRTDVLLLKDIQLIPKAQIIWSLLSQTEYDGMFAQLWYEFIRDYCELLSQYNMEKVLDAPWIFDPQAPHSEADIDTHLSIVQTVTEKQKWDYVTFAHIKQREWLLVFDLADLLISYQKKIRLVQEKYSDATRIHQIIPKA